MSRWFTALAGAVLGLGLSVSAGLAAPAPATPKPVEGFAAIARTRIALDPAVRTGRLDNGLRYAVMHGEHPKGALSIRLGIDVGSYEEAEGERGIAHFIEHMAFRSTRNFPGNTVDGAFAPKGVAFGRDHNAFTGLFSTRFELDLPRTDEADIARGFVWLRDVADGVVFDPAAVDVERGVVLAEKEATHNAASATYEDLVKFRGPNLRSYDRTPIGTDAVLHAVTAEQLQAFYRRWYRPDNSIVVVAGDLPLEVMEARIKAAFASWQAPGAAPERAPRTFADGRRDLEVFTRSEGSTINSVDVCKLSATEQDPPQDLAHVRQAALGDIWRQVMNRRLAQTRLQAQNQLLAAEFSQSTSERDHALLCLEIKPTGDGWGPALAAGEAELIRFQKTGPTELEVEQATESVRSSLRGAVTEAPNSPSAGLADGILDRMLKGQLMPEPRQFLRAFDLAVADLSVADLRAAFATEWGEGPALISVILPTAPSPAEVRQAWLDNAKGVGLAAYVDRQAIRWGYPFTPVGEVASREVVANGDFVRLRFKNGVVLNFKQTAFSKNQVAMAVRFGLGRREIDNHDIFVATLGGVVMPFGGTGKHSSDEILQMASVDLRGLQIGMGDEEFYMSDTMTTPNLEDRLRVAAAYMLDPGFRPTLDPVLHESADLMFRSILTSPGLTASNALTDTLEPNSPATLPPRPVVMAYDSAKVAEVLKPAMTEDPLDVTLVGDVDEATAVRLVAESFGALPPRRAAPLERAGTYFTRYPANPPTMIRVQHNGPADQAVAEMVWPLYVAEPARRREEYSIDILAAIFSNELRKQIRGDLGKTYSPTVSSHLPDFADQGTISAVIESYPTDLEALTTATKALAHRLAAGEITPEALEAARAPMLAQNRQQMETNDHWANGLSGSAGNDQNLKDILGFGAIIASIRLDEVKKAAADWLARDPVVVIASPAPTAVRPTTGAGS